MDFLIKTLFEISGFEVKVWMLATLISVILLFIIFLIILTSNKKQTKKVKTVVETKQEIVTPVTPVEVKNKETSTPVVKKEKPVVNEVESKEETSTSVVKKENTSTTSTAKKVTNYHVSWRNEDNKWQVKREGAEKPLKMFDTQLDAITYAKERANNQENRVIIHKKDGKIRKQKY